MTNKKTFSYTKQILFLLKLVCEKLLLQSKFLLNKTFYQKKNAIKII